MREAARMYACEEESTGVANRFRESEHLYNVRKWAIERKNARSIEVVKGVSELLSMGYFSLT